jgi:glycosyltransferase involved in cell wall biosynthesis
MCIRDSSPTLPPGIKQLVYFAKVFRAARGADFILAFDTWSTGLPSVVVGLLTGTKVGIRIGGDYLWESYIERGGPFVKLSEFYTTSRKKTLKERIIFLGTKWLLKRAIPIFNSEWLSKIWQSAYLLNVSKVSFVENVFPEKSISASATTRTFVAAGRGSRLKNIPMVERIFDSLKRIYPDIELDTRALPFKEHQERVKTCYAVLVPSVSEVNPNTIIEAISCGKPFVCTSDTGLNSKVKAIGLHVDSLDEQVFRMAIETLLDPKQYTLERERIEAFSYKRTWMDVTNDILLVFQKA